MFDQIEKLKQDYTDKYVVVAPGVPELARFGGHVGQVKTVNMNGRALVEFDAWNNIGWYDIDPGFLTIVPKPEAAAEAKAHDTKQTAPRPATKATATMEPGEKKLSALEMARQQGAVKPAGAKPAAPAGEKPVAAAGAKQSTADILAAARANKAATAPAAGAPAAAAPAAKPSTADILAAARANKAAAAPAAEASAAAPTAAKPAPAPPAAAAPARPKAAAAEPALPPGQRLSVPQILDWCRQHDAK